MVEDDEHQSEQPQEKEESEYIAGLAEILNLGVLEPQQADGILAFVRRRFQSRGRVSGRRAAVCQQILCSAF